MPKTEHPILAPFRFHGVDIDPNDGPESIGRCPFCDREGKYYVNNSTGQYSCKVCGASGNATSFLRQLWEASDSPDGEDYYTQLKEHRRLLSIDVIKKWGVRRGIVNLNWILPGYGAGGKLDQLYRYTEIGNRMALLATPNTKHALFGLSLWDPEKPAVIVCEGPWDGMALFEVMRYAREENSGLTLTGSVSSSLLNQYNIVAVPGCMTFSEGWLSLFSGKVVYLFFDSDHPKEHPRTKQLLPSAGFFGMQRAAGLLLGCGTPPASVSYLDWGEKGYAPDKDSGWDVRDHLTMGSPALQERIKRLAELLSMVKPVPDTWAAVAPKTKTGMDPLPCSSWEELVMAWRKAFRWTEGLEGALAVLLAVICSTNMLDDQLWLKLISPPSSGKTALCEALTVARKWVHPKDTISSLFSGYQSDKEGTKNQSRALQMKGMTLIVKDADTILKHSNLTQLLSQFRALYDRAVRVSYGNEMSADFEGLTASVILAGTKDLRKIDSSELGERFLDYVIMEDIDDDLEDEIGWRKINRLVTTKGLAADGKPENMQSPELTRAMQLTGGYVEYLRLNAQSLLSKVAISEENMRQCARFGKFVAYMRAQPSKGKGRMDDDTASRELSGRLVTQIGKLALCLTVVLQHEEVGEESMKWTKKVVTDTARGQSLNTAKRLHKAGKFGCTVTGLSALTGLSEHIERARLRFLKRIGCVESFLSKPDQPGTITRPKFRLAEKLQQLYGDVMGAQ